MCQHFRGIGSFLVGMAGLVQLALADAKRGLERVNPDEPDEIGRSRETDNLARYKHVQH